MSRCICGKHALYRVDDRYYCENHAIIQLREKIKQITAIVDVMEVARQAMNQHPSDEDEWDDDDQSGFEREMGTILESVPKLKALLAPSVCPNCNAPFVDENAPIDSCDCCGWEVAPSKEPELVEYNIFDFIYDRLVEVHGESKNVDYMLKYKKTYEQLKEPSPPNAPCRLCGTELKYYDHAQIICLACFQKLSKDSAFGDGKGEEPVKKEEKRGIHWGKNWTRILGEVLGWEGEEKEENDDETI